MNRRSYLFRGLLATLVFTAVAIASYQLGVHSERQSAAAQQAKTLTNLVADVEYHTTEALVNDDLHQAFTWATSPKVHAPEDHARLRLICTQALFDKYNVARDAQNYASLGMLYTLAKEVAIEPHLLNVLKDDLNRHRKAHLQEKRSNGESPFRLLSNS